MSKSDEKLRAELADAGVTAKPKRVTLAEAKAESTGKPARATTKATATTDGAAAVKKARVQIEPGSKPSAVLAAHITEKSSLYQASVLHKGEEPDHHAVNRLGKAIDGLAKKVGEKAVNLLRNRSNPDGVQVYTRIGMDLLLADGSMTSKDLADKYRATKYKDGTARAQSNQVFQLFPALGIATREGDRGNTLKLNRDSAIVADYRKAIK